MPTTPLQGQQNASQNVVVPATKMNKLKRRFSVFFSFISFCSIVFGYFDPTPKPTTEQISKQLETLWGKPQLKKNGSP
jgi:hypothetical protein